MPGTNEKWQVASKTLLVKKVLVYGFAATNQDGEGGPVVEPEGGVVDVAMFELEISGETSERTIHLGAWWMLLVPWTPSSVGK